MARRSLRRNPRTDAFARQLKHRAHVSAGRCPPTRFLSFSAGASEDRSRDMEVRTPLGNICGNLADKASSDVLRTKRVYDESS